MQTLDQARTLGGIGSILLVLSFMPLAGSVLGLIGFILVLIAVKYISDIVGDDSIFKNYLIAAIVGIVGLVVTAFVGVGSVMLTSFTMVEKPGLGMGSFLLTLITILVVAWIISIVSAIFIRKSFNAIASALDVKMFSTAPSPT